MSFYFLESIIIVFELGNPHLSVLKGVGGGNIVEAWDALPWSWAHMVVIVMVKMVAQTFYSNNVYWLKCVVWESRSCQPWHGWPNCVNPPIWSNLFLLLHHCLWRIPNKLKLGVATFVLTMDGCICSWVIVRALWLWMFHLLFGCCEMSAQLDVFLASYPISLLLWWLHSSGFSIDKEIAPYLPWVAMRSLCLPWGVAWNCRLTCCESLCNSTLT